MEGPEAGLTTAVQEATEMRRRVGAHLIEIWWNNEHGEVQLVVGYDGWDLYVNGDMVPRSLAHGRSET